MIDYDLLRDKKVTLKELTNGLTVVDLHDLTDEMLEIVIQLIEGASDDDVIFEPSDPEAHDQFASDPNEVNMPWTLGHVIVHITASAEEGAAQATTLARGVEITGRSRYETHWQTIHTIAQVRHRLDESCRMCHTLLSAWPDEPHLENTYTPKYPGAEARNAIGYYVASLGHSDAHLGQIKDIMEQARSARTGVDV
jgi:hypothetical protein